ncbi:MAG: UMP kinase [Patescibacteria group bacterium]
MRRKTIILSLGGSIIIPDRINTAYLKKFRSLVLRYVRAGHRFVIVTGGGDICRHYQHGASAVSHVSAADLDWIGIAATRLNAELVRSVFGPHAYGGVLGNPMRRVATAKRIIVGSGWRPGHSSDKDAVMLAKVYQAKTVINMSNIPYVYTADPRKSSTAKPIKRMSWGGLLKLTGSTWRPGAHVPFDPEASKLARKLGLRVVVCRGTDLKNLGSVITGKKFRGTVIA